MSKTLVYAPERATKLRLMVWWAMQLDAAERIASCQDTSPIPRSALAARIEAFGAMVDRERGWDLVAEGEDMRRRTFALAACLKEQGARGDDVAAAALGSRDKA